MSVFALATAAPVKSGAGPTKYNPLRDSITDPQTNDRLQLVGRVGDAEPFVLRARAGVVPGATPLVDALNAANTERHALRAKMNALPAESERVDAETAEAAEITSALKALPRIDALLCAPVATALMLYSRADDAAAESASN